MNLTLGSGPPQVLAIGALALTFALHTAPRASATTLPAAVRAEMPPAVLSVSLFEMAPTPQATKFLFHLWTAARRNPEGGGSFGPPAGYYKGRIGAAEAKAGGLRPSPFVLDIFSPGQKKGQWKYENSVITTDTKAPHDFTLRYLDARKKVGYVISTHGFVYRSGDDTLHVFADGWGSSPASTTFGYSAYMDTSFYSFPRDKNGLLQVMKHEHKMNTGFETRTTLAWKTAADFGPGGWQAGGTPAQVPLK